MTFFDDPAHRPPTTRIEVGNTVTGVIQMQLETDRLSGDARLTYTIAGVKRWANRSLWRALDTANVDNGELVTITRLPDNEKGWSAWHVVRGSTTPTAPAPTAPAPAAPASNHIVLPDW